MFKDMLGTQSDNDDTPYVKEMESHFIPAEDFSASYSFMIEGVKKPLFSYILFCIAACDFI